MMTVAVLEVVVSDPPEVRTQGCSDIDEHKSRGEACKVAGGQAVLKVNSIRM